MTNFFNYYLPSRLILSRRNLISLLVLALIAFVYIPTNGFAHCDTLSGPVIKDAKSALQKKDITSVLKWVKKEDEKEIRELFSKTLAVRARSPEARDLADMYFFETLVRVHRAGEGAPYTGLKAIDVVEPGIEMADQSVIKGSAAGVIQDLNKKIENGIRKRFERVIATKKHANDNVKAGREFVEAYVDYIHFVENLNTVATAKAHFDHSNEITSVKDKHK